MSKEKLAATLASLTGEAVDHNKHTARELQERIDGAKQTPEPAPAPTPEPAPAPAPAPETEERYIVQGDNSLFCKYDTIRPGGSVRMEQVGNKEAWDNLIKKGIICQSTN